MWYNSKGRCWNLEYTKNGVLRKENGCEINFINFGIEDDITNISIQKEEGSLTISNLKNGNQYLNKYGSKPTDEDIKTFIKISQNDTEINDFGVVNGDTIS